MLHEEELPDGFGGWLGSRRNVKHAACLTRFKLTWRIALDLILRFDIDTSCGSESDFCIHPENHSGYAFHPQI
jgi:hypothetical protein